MFKVNEDYLKLRGSYLFSNIGKKVNTFAAEHPEASIIKMGIGDVTQPLVPAIINSLHDAVDEMGHIETFHGYAPDLGYEFLRKAIADNDYKARGCQMEPSVTLAIFRRFFLRTIRLQSATQYIQYMWIQTLWQAAQAALMRRARLGVMSFTCRVQKLQILHQSFRRRHQI